MTMRDELQRSFKVAARTGLVLAVCIPGLMNTGSATSTTPQDMRGVWNGFIQAGGAPPERIRTEITSQTNRRFTGLATPPDPVQPVAIEGTVSASGKVNFQGQASDGHTVGKTDLTDFGGGAAILNGSMTRVRHDGTFIIPCVLELRPFEAATPDPIQPAGRYEGSMNGDGAAGQIVINLSNPPDPVRPTSFNGNIQLVIGDQTHTLALLGTMNAQGRFIAIAHFPGAGHMVVDANLGAPPDPVQPTTLNGIFTVEFGDGSELEGRFETELTRTIPT